VQARAGRVQIYIIKIMYIKIIPGTPVKPIKNALNKLIGIEAIEKKLSAAKVKSPKSEFKISLASVRTLSLKINAAQKMSIIPAKKPIKTSSKDIYKIPPVLRVCSHYAPDLIYASLVRLMSSKP
jgi:hypothetical protein